MNINQDKTENKRILLVDDEDDIIIPIKIHLEDNGFEVDIFTDPLLAFSNFKTNYYDLVIIDIRMPELNGFELYHMIKEKDDKVRICFFTATESYYEDLKNSNTLLSKEQFMLKPVSLSNFLNQVKIQLQNNPQ